MNDKEQPSDVDDLSDRRPTPKELPAFAPPEPGPEPDHSRIKDEFWAAMVPFYDGFEQIQAELLTRLIRLVLPDLKRVSMLTIRDVVRKPRGLSEKQLREWESLLGTVPARVREAKWLDEMAYPLERVSAVRGMKDAQKGDSGVISGRALYLLHDGRLGLVELSGLWKKGDNRHDTLTTFADAELIDTARAVKEFHLHRLMSTLREILWSERGTAQPSEDADREHRRTRFMATVKDLSKAVDEYNNRIRRAGMGLV
jgi:hypothetical protein